MTIIFDNLPNLSSLIETMDRHPVGSLMLVVIVLILAVATAFVAWIYFTHR